MNDISKRIGLACLTNSYELSMFILRNTYKLSKIIGIRTFKLCIMCGSKINDMICKAKRHYFYKTNEQKKIKIKSKKFLLNFNYIIFT